ncbi:prolipoprotein diacylglyceryl transferase [Helicobacter sp. MIT 05-5293]|uniref:prolipoprotein diacylglyceryl transferase n=1 Tax=Helicobacter sp. MIT 05-5293 TaxID=1548149 RepID=UPI0010FD7A42|nr:prolipoprotein diacylglyceryl transferase [Helicobacter sp. MIT 05-5293]TLD80268.1 prolipoprotein diacylglyceryl transferase [Helicobacter sp. MIT 05-5293]
MDTLHQSSYSAWNHIYDYIDPIAFEMFGINVHWYGIAYVSAMLVAFFIAKAFVKYHNQRFPITQELLDSFFIWVEIGVILGGRIGYVMIYSPQHRWDYLLQPWTMFNPYVDGVFVGISGISYHGALVGFVLAAILFCVVKKQNFFIFMDLSAISIPLGYVFGRLGNFLNHELYGREIQSDSFAHHIGILVDGTLRYPSQLFEAFTEGVVVFIVMILLFKYAKRPGSLLVLYGFLYSLARFSCEFFREADSQMGYYALGLSMGQILSLVMIGVSVILALIVFLNPSYKAYPQTKHAKRKKR